MSCQKKYEDIYKQKMNFIQYVCEGSNIMSGKGEGSMDIFWSLNWIDEAVDRLSACIRLQKITELRTEVTKRVK